MSKLGFTAAENAEYKAVNHDIEEALVQLTALKIRKIAMLEKVLARNGNEELRRLVNILKGCRPDHV